ncbi:MAG: hypothetical protein HDT33_02660 [Clostridiales bacterium]|nr:hypothetical protein [Clostridiales bacterium]
MDYISKLTDDELTIICDLTPIRYFRAFFKNHTKDFHKICPGYRPETISVDKVKSIAVSHRSSPFLSDCLNLCVKMLLSSVEKEISALVDAGNDIHTALLRVLPESYFSEHISLYFKLVGETYTKEYVELFQIALREMESRKGDATDARTVLSQDNSMVAEIEKLQGQLKSMENTLETERMTHLRDVEDLNAKNAILQEGLQVAQISYEAKERELADLQNLISHADLPSQRPIGNSYPYMSLCCVGALNGSSLELLRIADIIDGEIRTRWQEDAPNRNVLFTKDRSKPQNFIGVWSWKTEPNYNATKPDYIISEFQAGQIPIEIVVVPDCRTIDDLKKELLQGITRTQAGRKTLFAFSSDEKYIGLLCQAQDLSVKNERATLRQDIMVLPQYEFTESEITKTNKGWFYYRVSVGTPKALIPIMDPLDAVKRSVLKRVPWSRLKSWFTKKDTQKFQELLKEIPANDFYQEIAFICNCPLNEAETYVNDFIERAETYLRQEDIESETLLLALEHSPALLDKCQSLIMEQWQATHKKQLDDAEADLSRAIEATKEQQDLYNRLTQQQEQIQSRLEKLTADISKKETLASDVENKVAQRIDAAKKNVADFICEMAFSQPEIAAQSVPALPISQNTFQSGQMLQADNFDHHETWDELLCTIEDELKEAGVSKNYSSSVAAYLYAAYIAQTPLLLAGPNGRDIADAFSVAMFGKTASIMRCDHTFSINTIDECIADSGPIVIAVGVLNAGWISHIAELCTMKGKFVIAVHPFAEDLLIEPKGLYNYFLPILTELFVDKPATRKFVGGCFSEGFQHYSCATPSKHLLHTKMLPMNSLVNGRLRQIIANMHTLLGRNNVDNDVLLSLFPYAYVIGKARNFWDEIRDMLSKDTKELLQAFLGDTE